MKKHNWMRCPHHKVYAVVCKYCGTPTCGGDFSNSCHDECKSAYALFAEGPLKTLVLHPIGYNNYERVREVLDGLDNKKPLKFMLANLPNMEPLVEKYASSRNLITESLDNKGPLTEAMVKPVSPAVVQSKIDLFIAIHNQDPILLMLERMAKEKGVKTLSFKD